MFGGDDMTNGKERKKRKKTLVQGVLDRDMTGNRTVGSE